MKIARAGAHQVLWRRGAYDIHGAREAPGTLVLMPCTALLLTAPLGGSQEDQISSHPETSWSYRQLCLRGLLLNILEELQFKAN